jgi:hypothetical protein
MMGRPKRCCCCSCCWCGNDSNKEDASGEVARFLLPPFSFPSSSLFLAATFRPFPPSDTASLSSGPCDLNKHPSTRGNLASLCPCGRGRRLLKSPLLRGGYGAGVRLKYTCEGWPSFWALKCFSSPLIF